MTLGRVEVEGGAVVVAALLFYLDRSGVFGAVLLSCFCHELGHWGAIRALGGRVAALRLTWAGAEMKLSGARTLSGGRLALCALAGPGVNLLLAAGGALLARHGVGEGLYLFAGVNLGLACFNLLPVRWLDGGRAVESLMTALGRREQGRRVTAACSVLTALLLLAAGGCLLWQSDGRSFTVLLAGVWMAWMARRG